MNYILQILYMARFERSGIPTNLNKAAPLTQQDFWKLPGYVLWIFLVVQILLYPLLGAFIERSLYGTNSKARKVRFGSSDRATAIQLRSFSKHYVPSWWTRHVAPFFGSDKRDTVVAVNNIDLDILKGQIMCLLGANGSGKSTTMDAITGLGTITAGEIDVDGTGGIGFCPQKNVLWDELTVYEHVAIFNGLKCTEKPDSRTQSIRQV